MSLTRFRCANSLKDPTLGEHDANRVPATTKKAKPRGRAGIEPATSPTRRENHTSRPTALTQPPTRIELVTLCLRGTCSAN